MVVKLARREHDLYCKLPSCYQEQRFKRGIRIADKILKNDKSPLFSKALAWKGLFVGLLGKPSLGMRFVTTGLKRDSDSSLCWHVQGKLKAMEGEFDSAIECYTNALMIAPQNAGVTKDLAFTQAHLGDVIGYKQTAADILKRIPNSKDSWILYVMASLVSGDNESALNVLSTLLDSSKDKLSRWEESELLLCQNNLLVKVGDRERALTQLLENRHMICDLTSADEILAELHIDLAQYHEAVQVIYSLLKRNPNNKKYYELLFSALRLTTDASQMRVIEQLIEELGSQHTLIVLHLEFSSCEKFVQQLTNFLKYGLSKGSANLFQILKPLLSNQAKKEYIKSLLTTHYSILNRNVNKPEGMKKDEMERFSNLILLARIYDFEGDQNRAFEAVKKANLISPLAADGYVTRAKIMKHSLNPTEACRAMEKAQRLEPDDRWLLAKLIKYLLRADLVEEAESFYKHILGEGDEVTQPHEQLWYTYERASTFRRLGKFEEALKLCNEVETTIVNVEKSLFEIHSTCLNMSTLRYYSTFIDELKNLRRNKFYLKTALLAVQLAIQLQDDKLKQFIKNKKAKRRSIFKGLRPKKPNDRSSVELKREDSSESDVKPPKNNPDFFQDYLLSVRHFLRHIQTYQPQQIESQLTSFEVYKRLKRPLLMMQSLIKARKIKKNHHLLLVPSIQLYTSLMKWSAQEKLPQKKLAVLLEMGNKGLWKNRTAEQMVKSYLSSSERDLRYFAEGAKAMYLLQPSRRGDALQLASYTGQGVKNLNVNTCKSILDEMRKGSFGPCNEETEAYRSKCADMYKYSTAFDIDAVKEIRRKDLVRTIATREPIVTDNSLLAESCKNKDIN